VWLAAAVTDAPTSTEGSYALLNIVFIFAGVVVTVAGGVITALINRSAKTTPSPPPPVDPVAPDPGVEVRSILRQLQERADDCDLGRDITDRQVYWLWFCVDLLAQKQGIDLPRPPPRHE
jgi:hypothetical protein